jgi:transposase
MFIRVNKTPNSPRCSVQIVESIRSGDKVRIKIVHHVGIARDEEEVQKLKDYGKELMAKIISERESASPQLSLFPSASKKEILEDINRKPGRPKKKELHDILPTSQVTLDDIVEEKRIIEGVHDIAGAMFDEMYAGLFKGKRGYEVTRDVVLSRLVYPKSKRNISQKLSNNFGKEQSVEMIYWMMDQLYPKIDAIKKMTFNKTKSLFPEKIDLLLFDVTTLYFESVETDELRNFGYSKDLRFKTTQVVLALATNQDGLPIGYELFEGNCAEVTTLVAAIESWKKLFDIHDICFVGDRAMFSGPNLQLLEEKKYHYIIAAKLKKLPEYVQQKVFDEQNYKASQVGDNFAWVAQFPFTLIDCALFILNDIPKPEDIAFILDGAARAYAFIDEHFYFLNTSTNSCVKLSVSDTQIVELKKALKVKRRTNCLITSKICLNKNLDAERLDKIRLITNHHLPGQLTVSYKSSRAFKDQKDRQHILEKIRKALGEKGNPNKLISNSGVKQFITKDENAAITLDPQKIDDASQWDGLHGIITNIPDQTPTSLLVRYSNLWVIEESFRINKHTLRMRPMFHWVPRRIHAHIALCYMTFSILRHLQYRINLTQKVSINTILDTLLNTQASIYIHKKTKDRYRVPGYFSNDARKIYKAFGLERSLNAEIFMS